MKEEKQKVGQMRKREIREAAKKCFLDKGFQNTSAVMAEYTSFKSLHTALGSLYETNFVEIRTMCTMQC